MNVSLGEGLVLEVSVTSPMETFPTINNYSLIKTVLILLFNAKQKANTLQCLNT